MKKIILSFLLIILVFELFSQQDIEIGYSSQLNLQRKNIHGDAWLLHNAEYSRDTDILKWETTHNNLGSRGIRFSYSSLSGMHFYADNKATVAGEEFTPTTRFFIGNNGKVGVGTTSPTGIFTIRTLLGGELLSIRGSYNNNPKIFEVSQNASDGMVFVRNALEQTVSKISGHKPVPSYFLSNVGFGTESPSGNLTIQTAGDKEIFSIKGSYTNNPKLFEVTQEASDGMVYVRNALGQTISKISGYKPIPSYFLSNVGIGTTTTGTHKLAVDGTIGAREIKVEATGWSDFVFEDNYKLKDLEEVESFINDNKHLPDVPSEKEVLKNGIQLGEMDAKLLQKIEELTLYMIEQNKMMKAQSKEIQVLRDKINTLETL